MRLYKNLHRNPNTVVRPPRSVAAAAQVFGGLVRTDMFEIWDTKKLEGAWLTPVQDVEVDPQDLSRGGSDG